MSQFRLIPKKKRRSSALPIFIVVLIIAFFAGSFIAYSIWEPSSNVSIPSKLISLVAQPTSSIELVFKQATECTIESKESFVVKVHQINATFEDNFVLAASTSRIALSPIVGEMQRSARELSALQPDLCGKIVQEELLVAYDEAIDIFLAFMRQEDSGAELIISRFHLQDAYQFLAAYEDNVSYPLLLRDESIRRQALVDKLPIPTQVNYLNAFADKSVRCDEYELFMHLLGSSYLESRKHYNYSSIGESTTNGVTPIPTESLCDGYRWLDTPTPTSTPIPTTTPTSTITPSPSDTPTETPVPSSHNIEFYLEGSETRNYSVEYAENSATKRSLLKVLGYWKHSFSAKTGDELLFYVITPTTEGQFACVILIDGQVVIRKEKGKEERAVKCIVTVP